MSDQPRTLNISTPVKPLNMDLLKSTEQQLSPEAVEQLQKARQNAAAQMRYEGPREAEDLPISPDATVEEVDSVEVRIPNGKIVEYGPRNTVSTRIKIAQMMGTSSNNVLFGVLSTIMNIRAIDGLPTRTISNLVEAQAVANEIGDSGLAVLEAVHVECWPFETREALPILKKNLRRSGI